MTTEQKEKVRAYLDDQLANVGFRLRSYLFTEKGERRPHRDAFTGLVAHVNDFLDKESSVRWLTMYGLRGTGKTTLLAQLYEQTKVDSKQKLFLSVDQIVTNFGVTLWDVLEVYEEILRKPFEQFQEPVFLFLDEVHYDSEWGVILKTIYDRAHNVFIVATGSSALSLQANADVARRTIFTKLLPLSFMEYVHIKRGKTETPELSKQLAETIFTSTNAKEVYEGLKAVEGRVTSYWQDMSVKEIDQYMQVGTLPFMLTLSNEALVYEHVKRTLERIATVDIPHIKEFSGEIISKISAVLYALSETDQLNLTTIAENVDMSRQVLAQVLETLERTEAIWRVRPHGSHAAQSRKSSKYLFTSPAFRATHFNYLGSTSTRENYMGKLLEDTIGLYLNKLFSGHPDASVTYDSAAGGADFIVRIGKKLYVLEAGMGDKSFKQVETTMRKHKVKAQYGMVVSQSQLRLDEGMNTVSIPLQYFLLL